MSLSKRQIEILQQMTEQDRLGNYDDAEIAAEGLECWLGYTKISRRSVSNLIEHVAIAQDDGTWPTGYCRFVVNAVGRLLAKRPDLADVIWLKVQRGENIAVTDDGIEDLEEWQKKWQNEKTGCKATTRRRPAKSKLPNRAKTAPLRARRSPVGPGKPRRRNTV